ncbi:MAG: DUF2239 family protein [Deltaproteobacteria bacterium]|nr:DUF2239 family protein [Deltaproteobacteria bacterium]
MNTYTAFGGENLLLQGVLQEVLLTAWEWVQQENQEEVLVIDDATGRTIDFDYRGEPADVLAQLASHPMLFPSEQVENDAPKGPGRPRLGVVCREISLLPRHWEWLASQHRSASAALRHLIEKQMKVVDGESIHREQTEATYRLMSTLAGNCSGFEEASR